MTTLSTLIGTKMYSKDIPVVWVTHDSAQVWITFEDKGAAEQYARDLALTVSESVWIPRQTGDKAD